MSEKRDPYWNAIVERINGILKGNWLEHCFTTIEQARETLIKAVLIYNEKRPHDSLAYLTPSQAQELTRATKRNWRNYIKKYVTNNRFTNGSIRIKPPAGQD